MTTFLLTLKEQMIMRTEQMKQPQSPATHAPAGNKMTYTPPQMEVIKMDLEGSVMSASLTGFESGGSWGSPSRSSNARRSYNSASGSELEDLINDILTVEQ